MSKCTCDVENRDPDPECPVHKRDKMNQEEAKLMKAVQAKDWDTVIRTAKQLKVLEDAIVVYRLTRKECDNV